MRQGSQRLSLSLYVLDANDSSMSGAQEEPPAATAAHNSSLNGTEALGLQDDTTAAIFEFQVFNIIIAVLALCILAFTGLYCITVCFNRNRQLKRAHAYESTVTREEPADPVAVRAVKRSTSFINPFALFRRPEVDRDKSKIYYIYSNPLPIGLEEEEEEREQEKREEEEQRGKRCRTPCGLEQTAPSPSLLIRKYAEDPNSGVTLDPPMFYMQL
ncbi:unnamed protein product [Merluccius merluccius]